MMMKRVSALTRLVLRVGGVVLLMGLNSPLSPLKLRLSRPLPWRGEGGRAPPLPSADIPSILKDRQSLQVRSALPTPLILPLLRSGSVPLPQGERGWGRSSPIIRPGPIASCR
jgi:hypothetical protein